MFKKSLFIILITAISAQAGLVAQNGWNIIVSEDGEINFRRLDKSGKFTADLSLEIYGKKYSKKYSGDYQGVNNLKFPEDFGFPPEEAKTAVIQAEFCLKENGETQIQRDLYFSLHEEGKLIDVNKEDIAYNDFKGSRKTDVKFWKEKSGYYYLIRTQNDDMKSGVFAYLIMQDPYGNFHPQNKFEYQENCDFDLMDKHYSELSLRDADSDGKYEIHFMVMHGCVSDVSPVPVKLFVWEHADTYYLKGLSYFEGFGDEGKVTEPGSKIQENPAFLMPALSFWEENIKKFPPY